jgi:ABC-2 type transport system ATP-binding protein
MRRRLDIAASLTAAPPVLFLDEPTTGLDPVSRSALWEMIAELAVGGTAVLLTTQYLEEADRLADQIVLIDHGAVIARGTPEQLKKQIGGERIEVVVRDRDRIADAVTVLRRSAAGELMIRDNSVQVVAPAGGGAWLLGTAISDLRRAGIELDDAGLRRPTLDDVFFTLTGHAAASGPRTATGVPGEDGR